jgi:diazepam-binding inhibitor (GABA receptor modulating acyl-CoA-binding protein)
MNIIETVKPVELVDHIIPTVPEEPTTFTIYDNNTEQYDNTEPDITPQAADSLGNSGESGSSGSREQTITVEQSGQNEDAEPQQEPSEPSEPPEPSEPSEPSEPRQEPSEHQEPSQQSAEIISQEPKGPPGPSLQYEKSNPLGPLNNPLDSPQKILSKSATIATNHVQIILPNTKDEVSNKYITFDIAKEYYFNHIRKNKKFSNNVKLEFYKYYKQATFGNCYDPKPWFYEIKKKAKWNAWESIRGMSILDACTAYVDVYNSVKK